MYPCNLRRYNVTFLDAQGTTLQCCVLVSRSRDGIFVSVSSRSPSWSAWVDRWKQVLNNCVHDQPTRRSHEKIRCSFVVACAYGQTVRMAATDESRRRIFGDSCWPKSVCACVCVCGLGTYITSITWTLPAQVHKIRKNTCIGTRIIQLELTKLLAN